jgi:hypothetical protein
LRIPEYYGDPGKSSIKYEADLILTKKTTDVLLLGHAYAPGGKPVVELDVGFRVGSVQKVLRVFGDREWSVFGASPPQPFIKMPLVYERAFGGVDRQSQHPERDWDWRNPVGTGFAISRSNSSGIRLPNIEYRDKLIRSSDDRPPPAGFGPIASHWQPRAAFAGTYDDGWMKNRQPLLPQDFDDRFFQCAPSDQQASQFLLGDEPVILLNLCPIETLRFFLPKMDIILETKFMDGERREHEAPQLHTIILEPDFPRVSLIWHSAIECHSKVYQLERTRMDILKQKSDSDEEDGKELDNLLDLV